MSEASLKVARYHCDALAIIDTTVVKVPIRALAAELDRDPAFASRWIGMLNGEVRRLRHAASRPASPIRTSQHISPPSATTTTTTTTTAPTPFR